MILTKEQRNDLADLSKWNQTLETVATWMPTIGVGMIADIDFKSKSIKSLVGYAGSCKDYLKMASLAVNTGKPFAGAEQFKGPYHWNYTAYFFKIRKSSKVDVDTINKICKKWGIADTEVFYKKGAAAADGDYALVVGDPTWMKSVELLSLFVMLVRNHLLPNQGFGGDYKNFMATTYPYLESLTELCMYGYANIDYPSYIAENKHNEGAARHDFNYSIHNNTGPSVLSSYGKEQMKNVPYKPSHFYYDYFKKKAGLVKQEAARSTLNYTVHYVPEENL